MIKIVVIIILSLLVPYIITRIWLESRRNSFFNALQKDDKENLTRLLEKGINVNIRSSYFGWTGLMYAAFFGHTECARLLIDRGARVNKRSRNNWHLIFMGHTEMVSYGFRYETGRTALMNAAMGGHFEIAKLLLEHGAEPNARTSSGWTALMAAASKGDADMVNLLTRNGADINIRDTDFKMTALEIAENKRHQNVVHLLRNASAGKTAELS